MDATDRVIMNALQDGFPVCDQPFERVAAEIGIGADELIARVSRMLETGIATRFGPLYNAERMGGAFTLAAMSVPPDDFERVANILREIPEVAHNYAREHALNMWFVVATESPQSVASVLRGIELQTGLAVVDLPKEREYWVSLRFDAERATT
jgi:DNA-binding Lrp family transcriptional regulator